MNTAQIPFAELSVEARTLLYIYATAAQARFICAPLPHCRLEAILGNIWDSNHLSLKDLGEPERMTAILEGYREELLKAA